MSKRAEARKQQEAAQRTRRLIIIGVIVVIAVAAVVLLARQSPQVGQVIIPTPFDRPSPSGTALGDPNAPVKIEEFADYQCPYCRNFEEQTLPQLAANEIANGQVYFVFHPFSFIGPESVAAANAALCAADQGKFWEYSATVYANQTSENSGNFSTTRLEAFAAQLGLDTQTFNSCFSQDKHQAEVSSSYQLGVQAGVQSTPSFLINGQLVTGALPYDQFQSLIQKAMNQPAPTSTP